MYIYTQRATSCPDYPVTSHTFVLEGKDRETPALKETNRGMVLSLEWNLPMNFQYSFHVVVANEVGLTYTTPVKICKYKTWNMSIVVTHAGSDPPTVLPTYSTN